MVDFLSNLTTIVTLIGSFVIIIGGIAAVYVYWTRRKFAGGKWTVRSITFYPPDVVKNIKFERVDWQEALPGEMLPPETLSVGASEGGPLIPVGGLKRVALKRTFNPPAVVVHFVAVNSGIIPVAIKEIAVTIKRLDNGSEYEFMPTHFGKKEAPVDSRVPPGLPFDEHWGPILIQPASSSEHRLVFVPSALLNPARGDVFEGLVAATYECAIEFRFERLFKIVKNRKRSRHIRFRIDVEETLVEAWNNNKPVTLPYSLIQDI
jgi:hypothetical protein